MIPVNILYFIIAILAVSLGFIIYKYSKLNNILEKVNVTNTTSSIPTTSPINSTNTTSSIPTTPVFYEFIDFGGRSYVSTPNDFGTLLNASFINQKIGITDTDRPNFASIFIPENYTIVLKDSNNKEIVGFRRPDVDGDSYTASYKLSTNLTNFNGGDPSKIWPAISGAKLVIYNLQTFTY